MQDKIYKIVRKIPCGNVSTYGQIAKMAGRNSPRLVGYYLHKNPDPLHIPCHRIVNAQGKVAGNYAFGGGLAQQKKLAAEGIVFTNDSVDLKKYLWRENG